MATTFNERFLPILGKDAGLRALVSGVAESIAGSARATAPVDTAEYVNGIRVEVTETENRVVARVIATSDASMVVESRTGNLARAAQRHSSG